jgi:type IV pilus assembly protein PilA
MNTQIKELQKGFTLVELLVVIAIIGILTAIGVPMYNGYQASAKVSATKQNFDAMKTFIAGEVTKCSAGLTPTLADPKAQSTIACPTGLTAAAAATYFQQYGLATMKNPYATSSTTAVNSTVPPTVAGELGISATGCTGGIAIQTAILDPNSTTPTVPSVYPASPDCISVQ